MTNLSAALVSRLKTVTDYDEDDNEDADKDDNEDDGFYHIYYKNKEGYDCDKANDNDDMIMATITEIMMMILIITMILGVQSRAVTDQVTPPASFSHIGGRTLKKNERMVIFIDTGCSKIIVFFRSV